MPAILGPNGLTIQTASEIASEQANRVRELTGNASLSFEGNTLLGQQNTASAERAASLQELLQGLDDAIALNKATGVQLTEYCLRGGIIRKPATQSLVPVHIGGTTGTTVAVGILLGMPSLSYRWSTTDALTLTPATAWAVSTVYAVGDVRKSNGQVWLCTTGGTSSGVSGPAYSGNPAVIDNTCHWFWIGAGDGYGIVNARSVDTGPIGCAQRGLTIIVTPVTGVGGCANLTAAEQGAVEETDAQLRLRYASSYHSSGTGTINAIYAALTALPDVTEARVYQNNTAIAGGGTPPIAGMPGHSVWAIVDGPVTVAEIGATLLAQVAGGIQCGWASAPNAVDASTADSQGIVQPLFFSTPVSVPVSLNVTVTYGQITGPASVQTDLEAALNALTIGADVLLWRLSKVVGDAMIVAGIDPELVTNIVITTSRDGDPFTAANVPIAYNEKAGAGAVSVTFA